MANPAQEPQVSWNIIRGRSLGQPGAREVISPFSGTCVTEVHDASRDHVNRAVEAAKDGVEAMAAMPGKVRKALLARAAEIMRERSAELAMSICIETGKAIRDCHVELARAIDVTELSATESVRVTGRHVPMDASSAGHERLAVSKRFPVGIVGGIVPFNAPINLTCHKLAPALAAGNSIIVKAPPQAPRTLELLVRAFLDAGVPPEAIGLIHGGAETGTALVRDARVSFLSFTGSVSAGLAVKREAGTRGCILELGGVGPTIVHKDADLELATRLIATAGFRLAGQSCASVQNVFVHTDLIVEFSNMLVDKVASLKVGDPSDPRTDLGPVIDESSAERIERSVRAAVDAGAKILCGGKRVGLLLEPTVLCDVTPEMEVVRSEIFGPVVVIRDYSDKSEPAEWINGTGVGINCGLFAESQSMIKWAHNNISCAALIVNGTSTFRAEQLPYGGIGLSGYGRECPADTVLAMTVERFLVL